MHQVLSIDELTGSSHTRIAHIQRHGIEPIEALPHARGQVSIFRVRGQVFKRPDLVFAFVVFFFAAVAPISSLRAIAAVVCSTMSRIMISMMSRSYVCYVL
jgi:hypothetical protein